MSDALLGAARAILNSWTPFILSEAAPGPAQNSVNTVQLASWAASIIKNIETSPPDFLSKDWQLAEGSKGTTNEDRIALSRACT